MDVKSWKKDWYTFYNTRKQTVFRHRYENKTITVKRSFDGWEVYVIKNHIHHSLGSGYKQKFDAVQRAKRYMRRH